MAITRPGTGTLPTQLRAGGAQTVYFDLKLASRVGTPDAPADPATIVDVANKEFDAAVVRYLDAHTRPGQKIFVLWAAADVYYLADRAPVIPYMWRRNIQAIPGVLDRLRRDLAAGKPALVAVVQSPDGLDRSGRTSAILASRYRRVAVVEGVPIYRPRQPS